MLTDGWTDGQRDILTHFIGSIRRRDLKAAHLLSELSQTRALGTDQYKMKYFVTVNRVAVQCGMMGITWPYRTA